MREILGLASVIFSQINRAIYFLSVNINRTFEKKTLKNQARVQKKAIFTMRIDFALVFSFVDALFAFVLCDEHLNIHDLLIGNSQEISR